MFRFARVRIIKGVGLARVHCNTKWKSFNVPKSASEDSINGQNGASPNMSFIRMFHCILLRYTLRCACLQRSVVRVVREKYLNQVCPEDELKFQRFLSELYVFLVDQMHLGLKKVGVA